VENSILENNLYGVDINEESVEIAKLSLWLRTAQKGRKLTTLNNNIKCGNSLIDDPEFAGEKAFNWQTEFPEIFAKGGFDVVIGNPPYVKEATNKSAFDGLHKHPCYQGKMDLWYFFGALALDIIKKDYGLIGYIAPNNWITNDGASKFRDYIIERGRIIEFIDFSDFKVFDSAGIQTMIYIMRSTDDNANYNLNFSKVSNSKIKHEDAQLFLEKITDDKFEYFTSNVIKTELINQPINFINAELNLIIEKIKSKENFNLDSNEIASGIDLLQDFVNKNHKEVIENVEIGDGIFNLSQSEYDKLNLSEKEKELLKPFYTTSELQEFYGNPKNKLWIIYTDSSFKDEEKILPYPNIKEHLDKFLDVFTSVNKPYGLHRSRDENYFKGEKIFSLRKCSVRPKFTYTDFDAYVNRTFMIIKTDRINQKFLTGILNSNLIAFWLKYKGKMQGNNYQIDKTPLENLPLINASFEVQEKISDLVNDIIIKTQKSLDYQELLNKAKTENNFDREIQLTKELEQLTVELEKAEKKINSITYELYEIEPNEIATIEKNIN
ncbi:MAG: Eco57I restriction-modification methylase domain-containing protein, partial [Bacteroidales bacterium]|nr:Eco57I restriction-modification methylase domain-containing protein [Bacteroidales bacterium]